jgi:putative oxygen-independent coproporphyrinogen III oxidase
MSPSAVQHPPPLALYIHFPWCVKKCPYCDFNSHALRDELPETQYLEALERDLAYQCADVAGRQVLSVFLGGGTPSLFSAAAIARVLGAARRHLDIGADAEVTLEANPGTVERGKFAEYRAAGVNRVSLGAQSFDPRQLQALGRIHSVAETERAAAELHAAGLANFNIDLMYALPGQDVGGALHDIDAALALTPAHVSHYQLTIEAGTVFAAQPPALPGDERAAEILEACQRRLARANFAQYEVSAYATAGCQCRHNLNYWRFGDYLGIGAGAHGKLTLCGTAGIVRTVQWREPRRYMTAAACSLPRRPVAAADLPFEFMLNALRLVDGFAMESFEARTALPWQTVAAVVSDLAARGLLELDGRICRPTALGFAFLNDVLMAFLPQRPVKSALSALSTAEHPEALSPNRRLYAQPRRGSPTNE